MTPLQILNDIITIAETIYHQPAIAENNKKKLHTLSETVRQVVTMLKNLEELPRQQQFIDGLHRLQTCLHETAQFIGKMQKMGPMERFAYAKTNQERIQGYKQQLIELAQLLHLGISAQHLVNHEQDREDDLKDRQEFVKQQENHLRQMQAAALDPRDLQDIVRKQLMSFQQRLEKQFSPLPSPIRSPVSPASPHSPLSPDHLVEIDEVIFERKIGMGQLGDVYQGKWREQPVTIKWLEGLTSEKERQQFMREAHIMSQLNHDSIVSFYGACFEDQRLCLIMGVMEKGNLEQVLPTLSLEQRLAIAKSLAQGLAYLHAKNIIHGDIHPKHIGVNHAHQAKWTDFGLVKTQASRIASMGVSSQEVAWQAPESWQLRSELSKASDMYSFGVLLWTLFTGKMPYADIPKTEIMSRIKRGIREIIPNDCSSVYAQLIENCWAADVTKRPTAVDVARTLQTLPVLFVPPPARSPSPTGEALYEQGVTAEKAGKLQEAYDRYQHSSEKGYFKSFTSLGLFALEGKANQPIDKQKAQIYFERAAKEGHSRAMYNLARMYEKGDTPTGTSDVNKALFWYNATLQIDPENTQSKQKIAQLSKK